MTVCIPSVSSKATAVRCPQKQHCKSVPHITPQPYFTSPEFPAQAWWAFLDLIVPDYGHSDDKQEWIVKSFNQPEGETGWEHFAEKDGRIVWRKRVK